jgi:hypothetical protein
MRSWWLIGVDPKHRHSESTSDCIVCWDMVLLLLLLLLLLLTLGP